MIESILVERGIEYVASEDITSFNPGEAKQYVCIDFTTPDAFRANYRFLADNFKAVVVGTTGWNDIKDEVVSYFENAGTPMIHASNFSLGVNVMFALADKAVGFEGANDRITISHEAFSRKGFAQGAVQAALMIENITGVKEFKDIII